MKITSRFQYFVVILLVITFFLSYLDYKILLNGKVTLGLDLALYLNTVYNTHTGRLLVTTISGENLILPTFDHGSGFIIALISLFAELFKDNILFFSLFKVCWLSAGSIAIYLISNERFNDSKYGLLFGTCYLFYPFFSIIVLSDFRLINLIITPILFSYYFFLKQKHILGNIFAFIALMVREEAIYLFAAMIIYFSFNNRDRNQQVKFILALFLQLIFLFFIEYPIQKFDFINSSLKYAKIQLTPYNLTNFQTIQSFALILAVLFLPFLFSGLFSNLNLINIPFYIEILLLGVPFSLKADVLHYYSILIPFTFLAAVDSISNIKKRFKIKEYYRKLILVLLIGFAITILILLKTDVGEIYSMDRYVSSNVEKDYLRINQLIDKNSPLATDGNIGYLFSMRPNFHSIPTYFDGKFEIRQIDKFKYLILPINNSLIYRNFYEIDKQNYKSYIEYVEKKLVMRYKGEVFILYDNPTFSD